ncbi:hypothetical protein [Parasitella parasitica]|uniref:Mitochondrial distribution and morphology protein 12 n=1 Tax=Parasitella parasitica TaxID=35722 RepID=A0A0B7NPL6_9FUNG|nr:hypothetical protein [Parasitella parasitica]
MSLDIDWKKLDSDLADRVQKFLNKHFQAITKPSFIGDVQVKNFQWGNEAPQIEIINITEPFPEFYEQEDANQQEANTAKTASSTKIVNPISTSAETNTSPIRPQPSPLPPQSEFFLSDDDEETNTARILLNTQRFNYMHSFHRSPFVAPQHPFSHSPGLYFSSPPTNQTPNAWNSSRPSSVIEEDWIDDEDINRVSDHLSSITPPSNATMTNKPSTEMDFQVHMLISYKGDMSMTVMTELRMNYPSVMFMSLPINLRVRSVEFEATAVVAYIQSMQRVCVSMLEPEDNRAGSTRDIGMDSLLRDVHIETIVGDEQKQVLKNVGKIEKFIVDQLRKMLDDELVFPSYQLIQLE